jgi:excisionase family DNA binding protein
VRTLRDSTAPDHTSGEETYLSPAQLARLLNVPRGTVYQWNARGTGPTYIQLGRHVRYRHSDVTEWLEQHQNKKLQPVTTT